MKTFEVWKKIKFRNFSQKMMSVHRFCVEHHIVTVNVTFSVALINYYLDVLPIELGAFLLAMKVFWDLSPAFLTLGPLIVRLEILFLVIVSEVRFLILKCLLPPT